MPLVVGSNPLSVKTFTFFFFADSNVCYDIFRNQTSLLIFFFYGKCKIDIWNISSHFSISPQSFHSDMLISIISKDSSYQ